MSQLLQNAAYGTALILAAALLRRVLRDRLIPEARLALWAVCLVRLLTPVPLESALSLWGLFQTPQQAASAAPPAYAPGELVPAVSAPAPAPQPAGPAVSWEMVLIGLWLAVGAALAVRYVRSWARTRRAVACAIPLDRADPRYTSLPWFARLREGSMEGAPLTFGVARPTVVLSPGLEGEALDCVLAHEGVHAARRDNLWHYAMALALAVHWWNPAVWLMARLLRRDIELTCDRAAVKRLGADRRADYANALVTLATQEPGPEFCQSFGRKATEERIRSIMNFKKTSVIGVIFTLALVLAVTAAFASDPKGPDEESTTSSAPAGKMWSMTSYADDDLKDVTITLDLLKESLAKHVADDSMPQGLADQILELAQSFLDEDGKALVWSFPPDSGLVVSHDHAAGADHFPVFYQDESGSLVPVDPADLVSFYILPAAGSLSAGDSPAYVEEDGSIAGGMAGLLGEGDIRYDGGRAGGAVRTSSGTYTPCADKDCGVSYDHCHLNGQVVRIYYQDPGLLCAHPDCDNQEPHAHDGVQYAGKAPQCYLVLSPDPAPVPSAAAGGEDAPAQSAYPRNSKGETYGTVPWDAVEEPDLQAAIGTKGELGYVRQSDVPGANVKNPQEALEYMEWIKTQPSEILIPLYDSEGNVIGQFSVSNSSSEVGAAPAPVPSAAPVAAPSAAPAPVPSAAPAAVPSAAPVVAPSAAPASTMYPVCTVDGCSLIGQHIHDGVTYCGGAGHHNGYCDGTCAYWAQSGCTQASVSGGGCHGGGHHGYGHH